jgi:hypothetical protein
MPPRLRLERERSIEIDFTRLSPKYGCGKMLADLPVFDGSDPLLNIMATYGYARIQSDKPGAKLVTNPALLKDFYDNALNHKTPVRRNWHTVFKDVEIYLALDAREKTAWFVADPLHRMALVNYYRDAVSLGLKAQGITLSGSTVRLTPVGWQNLHELFSDKFIDSHADVRRVDVMSSLAGIRWRKPVLGIGVMYLNLHEPKEIQTAAAQVTAGETGEILA